MRAIRNRLPERVTPGLRGALFAAALCLVQSVGGVAGAQSTAPRITAADFTYLGAFRINNAETIGTSSFRYGGHGLTVYHDTATGKRTIFMQGHAQKDGHVAQIEIPATVGKGEWSSLPNATILQNFADVTDGKLGTAGDKYNGIPIYGMMVHNNRLIVGASQAYGFDQSASHGVSSLNLSQSGDFARFYPFNAVAPPRALGGPMTAIPSEWQSAFGGPALTGNCCISIIGSTSAGPSATVFNPDDVGVKNPIPGKTVLYYPLDYPLCGFKGCEGTKNDLFNLTTRVVGVAFPRNTRSVLFIGGHGTGNYCYGTAGECNDPALPDVKGPHAQPYRHQVWAYDANDLVAVKNGSKQPWELRPYAVWGLPELTSNGVNVMGAGFDPETGRLYVAQDYGMYPKIDVYQIKSNTTTSVPNPPTSLTVQ
jgi:hypothetical protein